MAFMLGMVKRELCTTHLPEMDTLSYTKESVWRTTDMWGMGTTCHVKPWKWNLSKWEQGCLVWSRCNLGLLLPYCTSGPRKQQKECRGSTASNQWQAPLDQSTCIFQGQCCSPKHFPKTASLFLFLGLFLTLASKHTTATVAVSACSDELTVSCLNYHLHFMLSHYNLCQALLVDLKHCNISKMVKYRFGQNFKPFALQQKSIRISWAKASHISDVPMWRPHLLPGPVGLNKHIN